MHHHPHHRPRHRHLRQVLKVSQIPLSRVLADRLQKVCKSQHSTETQQQFTYLSISSRGTPRVSGYTAQLEGV